MKKKLLFCLAGASVGVIALGVALPLALCNRPGNDEWDCSWNSYDELIGKQMKPVTSSFSKPNSFPADGGLLRENMTTDDVYNLILFTGKIVMGEFTDSMNVINESGHFTFSYNEDKSTFTFKFTSFVELIIDSEEHELTMEMGTLDGGAVVFDSLDYESQGEYLDWLQIKTDEDKDFLYDSMVYDNDTEHGSYNLYDFYNGFLPKSYWGWTF